MTRADAPDVPGATRRTLALSAMGAVLVLAVLALAVLAAGGRPWASGTAPTAGRSITTPQASVTLPPPSETAAPSAAPSLPPDPTHSTGYLFLAFLIVVVVAVLVLLGRLLLRTRWRLRWGTDPGAGVRGGPAAAPAEEALPDAVDRALAAVDLPDAREAVVQAWLLLGEAAAAAGTPARPSETADEYARRLAEVHRLPGTSLQHLAALYREARFSDHPVRPEQRAQARAELEILRSALTAPQASR